MLAVWYESDCGHTTPAGKGINMSGRLCIVALPQGISGFRLPSVVGIITEARQRRDRLPIQDLDLDTAHFRMEDGHLPEFQPQGSIFEVKAFLAANPWSAAVLLPDIPTLGEGGHQ